MKKTSLFLGVVLFSLILSGCVGKENGKQEEEFGSEVSVAMSQYLDNLASLQKIEAKAYEAIEKENGEAFDLAVEEMQKETQEALLNIKKINQAGQEVSSNFALVAFAKERSSLFYHMPVIKHFAKAYDKALENKKNDAYNYFKNEMDEVEKNNILKRNNIKSLEDFKKLNGKEASKIVNSEPELYKMVNWTKTATDVGKAGVNAFVDALKGDNPLSATEIGKDYLSEKFKNSQKISNSKVKIKKGQGTVLGVNQKFKKRVDDLIPYQESDDYIITEKEEAEIQKLLENFDEKVIFGREIQESEEQEISLPAGDWNLTLGAPEKKPQEKEVKLQEKKSVEIDPASFGLNEFASPEALKEEVEKEVSQSDSIVGKWKVINIKGEYINSAEYMRSWSDQLPDAEFLDEGKILYSFRGKKGKLEGNYTFDGEKGQINLGTSPYMKIVLDGNELSTQSLLDTTSANPTTYFYERE